MSLETKHMVIKAKADDSMVEAPLRLESVSIPEMQDHMEGDGHEWQQAIHDCINNATIDKEQSVESIDLLLMNASLEILCTKRPIKDSNCQKLNAYKVHHLIAHSFTICEDFMMILNDECLITMKEHFIEGMVALANKKSYLEAKEHFRRALHELNAEYDYIINYQKLILLARMKIFCILVIRDMFFSPKQPNGLEKSDESAEGNSGCLQKDCQNVLRYLLERKVFQRAICEEYATDTLSYILKFRHNANDRMLICKEISLVNGSLLKFTGAKLNITHPQNQNLLLNKIRPSIPFAIRCHESKINSIVCSALHNRCYTCGDDRYIRTWDVSFEIPVLMNKLKAHSRKITKLLISDEKMCLFSCSRDGSVCVWDIRADVLVLKNTLDMHQADVCGMSINGSCTMLVSSAYDNTMIVWKMAGNSKTPAFAYEISDMYPNVEVVLSEKPLLYCGSLDGTLCIYNLERAPERLGLLTTHGGTIMTMVLDEGRNMLFTGSRDTSFILWDTRTDVPTCIARVNTLGAVQCIYASIRVKTNILPINEWSVNFLLYVATSDRKLSVYEVDGGAQPQECHLVSKHKKLGKQTGVHCMCLIHDQLFLGLDSGLLVEHIHM